jgi:hypothetical protein
MFKVGDLVKRDHLLKPFTDHLLSSQARQGICFCPPPDHIFEVEILDGTSIGYGFKINWIFNKIELVGSGKMTWSAQYFYHA